MNKLFRFCLLLSAVAVLALFAGIILQNEAVWKPAAVTTIISFAIGMGAIPALKSYRYTAWIIAAVVTAMIYPAAFTKWGDFDLRNKWLILIIIQLVMFGMGIQMSLKDFSGLATTGKGVLIGLLCHFSVMPLMGLLLTKVFHFEPEIAAGIILIGSCSSGLASNVMVYIARANLVLSVVVTAMATLAAPFLTPLLMKLLAGTLIDVKFINMMMEIIKIVIGTITILMISIIMFMNFTSMSVPASSFIKSGVRKGAANVVTAMATLAAPFLTPLLMKLLAGTLIDVKFINMMMEIIKIVIVPIGAALLHDYLKSASPKNWRVVTIIAIACAICLAALPLGLWQAIETGVTSQPLVQTLEILAFFMAAFLVGVLYHLLTKKLTKLDDLMPYVSMFGIIYFTTVTTAAGRDNLMKVGFLLFIASVIHNGAGYFFGYWLSRAAGLDKNSSRTVAFEVGLQNGGMASGLAGSMGKLGTVGLPAAVFSPWMNISGSLLANYWRRRPVNDDKENVTASTETKELIIEKV